MMSFASVFVDVLLLIVTLPVNASEILAEEYAKTCLRLGKHYSLS